MTIMLIFYCGKHTYPKVVEMYSADGIHGWVAGMTFCGDKKCNCYWPKVKKVK